VILSKLLDQGYKVREQTKTHLKLACNDKTIAINWKPNHQIFYLIDFKIKLEVYAAENIMNINKAHEKHKHMGERHPIQDIEFL